MNSKTKLRLGILRTAALRVLDVDLGAPEHIKNPHLCVLGLILVGLVQIIDSLVGKPAEHGGSQ